jgi:hypothetical protein
MPREFDVCIFMKIPPIEAEIKKKWYHMGQVKYPLPRNGIMLAK